MEEEEQQNKGFVSQGDIDGLMRRVRSVIGEFHERCEREKANRYGYATLRDFISAIHRLEDAADRFETGAPAPKRIPYNNVPHAGPGRDDNATKEWHESYGLLQFNRVSGGARLFGSHLADHQHFICMTVSRAELHHDLSRDTEYPTEELIEVWMSMAQFAECITAMNHGNGVPCTIKRVDGVRMEDVPDESDQEHAKIREGFEQKIASTVEVLGKAHDQMEQLIDSKKSISKGAAREMLEVLRSAHQELEKNAPFVVDQFRRSADKVVTSAKAEVEAFFSHYVARVGMAAIEAGDAPTLLLGEGTSDGSEEQ